MSLYDIAPIAAITAEIEKAEAHWAKPSQPSLPSLPSRPTSQGVSPETPHDANDGIDGNDGKLTMPTFYAKVKGRLPFFLERIAQVNDSDADADMLILGALAVLSACLPNISGIYAKMVIYPNLYLFVTARAVITCFCPPLPNNGASYMINHKDGKWMNCNYKNLK